MIEVGKGSCYRRVERGCDTLQFLMSCSSWKPRKYQSILQGEGAPEIETQADKESRMNYSHGRGGYRGEQGLCQQEFRILYNRYCKEHGHCLEKCVIQHHHRRLRTPLLCPLDYINALGFKLCRYSVTCYKPVDLLQIFLPGDSDCRNQFVVLKHSTGLVFRSVQQPPYLRIEFSFGINSIHSVKLSLKKIFSL